MSAAFSKEGFRSLRLAWATLAIAVAAAAGVAWASHWFLQKEKRDDVASQRQLGEARAKLETAKREREDLRASAAMFQDLVNRGILREEKRLELVERLERLKERHRIMELDYEIAPQRPLPLAGGRVYNAIDIFASRVRVRAKALHEGECPRLRRGPGAHGQGFQSRQPLQPRAAGTRRRRHGSPRGEAGWSVEWSSRKVKRGGRPLTSLIVRQTYYVAVHANGIECWGWNIAVNNGATSGSGMWHTRELVRRRPGSYFRKPALEKYGCHSISGTNQGKRDGLANIPCKRYFFNHK